jgi:hypothetical protein
MAEQSRAESTCTTVYGLLKARLTGRCGRQTNKLSHSLLCLLLMQQIRVQKSLTNTSLLLLPNHQSVATIGLDCNRLPLALLVGKRCITPCP